MTAFGRDDRRRTAAPELTAHRLIRTVDLPIAWTAQKQLLGLG
jgi:hypothetical protein